jgi:hypothetical protein
MIKSILFWDSKGLVVRVLLIFLIFDFFVFSGAFAERELAGKVNCREDSKLPDPRDYCPDQMNKDCKDIFREYYKPPLWNLSIEVEEIQYGKKPGYSTVATGPCYAEKNLEYEKSLKFPITNDSEIKDFGNYDLALGFAKSEDELITQTKEAKKLFSEKTPQPGFFLMKIFIGKGGFKRVYLGIEGGKKFTYVAIGKMEDDWDARKILQNSRKNFQKKQKGLRRFYCYPENLEKGFISSLPSTRELYDI